jgi:hypothetical protein
MSTSFPLASGRVLLFALGFSFVLQLVHDNLFVGSCLASRPFCVAGLQLLWWHNPFLVPVFNILDFM